MLHGEAEGAFREMCLSLSGAYLALGRLRREEEWLSKAIEYAHNNKEALLQRGLHSLEKGNLSQAHADIMQAYNYEPRAENSNKIKIILTNLARQHSLPLPPGQPQ